MSRTKTYRAVEQEDGTFHVVFAEPLTPGFENVPLFRIVTYGDCGWYVRSESAGRYHSRTYSATPEQAAKKYFGSNICFEHLICLCGAPRRAGVCDVAECVCSSKLSA